MVGLGLSVILETRKLGGAITESTRQVIDKSTLNVLMNQNHNHHRNGNRRDCFLDRCFLCRQKLLPGKDIYMYE